MKKFILVLSVLAMGGCASLAPQDKVYDVDGAQVHLGYHAPQDEWQCQLQKNVTTNVGQKTYVGIFKTGPSDSAAIEQGDRYFVEQAKLIHANFIDRSFFSRTTILGVYGSSDDDHADLYSCSALPVTTQVTNKTAAK